MDDLAFEGTSALPLSDTNALLRSAAQADKQQALIAHIYPLTLPASQPYAATDVLARLSTLRSKLGAYIDKHAYTNAAIGGRYIWHREPPTLSLSLPHTTSSAAAPSSSSSSSSTGSNPTLPSIRLHLRTGGDCVEDEWFVTYILCQVTNDLAYFALDLAVTIQDEDGHFILIEAADVLPEWVSPENVENRVWIYRGRLHLIPLDVCSATIPPRPPSRDDADADDSQATVTVADAIRAVADPLTFTGVSDEVQQAAFARIQDYPLAAADHHHTTLAYLSRRVARLLQQDPQLVSNATEALTTRDVVSSRAAIKMRRFPCTAFATSDSAAYTATPVMDQDQDNGGDGASTSFSQPPRGGDDEHVVLTPVRMTRHLYAHLCYDRFFPPKAFGKPWQTAVEKYRLRMHQNANGGHRLGAPGTSAVEDEEEVQRELREGRWRDIGAKVWCGLEMAYEDSVARRGKSERKAAVAHMSDSTPLPVAAAAGEEYDRFVTSLRKLGYFGDELEGSARWQKLEEEAASQWQQLKATAAVQGDNGVGGGVAVQLSDKVDALLSAPSKSGQDDLTVVSPTSSPTVFASLEDSEDWMVVTTEDLDTMLESRFSSGQTPSHPSFASKADSEEDKALSKLQQFASKMDEFMMTQSDERGAAFVDELDDDDVDEDDDDDELMLDDGDDNDEDDEEDGEDEEERIREEAEKRVKAMDGGERSKRLEAILPGLAGIWAKDAKVDSKAQPPLQTQKPPVAEPANQSPQQDGAMIALSSTDQPEGLADVLDRLSHTHSLHIPTPPLSSDTTLVRPSSDQLNSRKLQFNLASQQMRATSTLLSRQHTHFDGASDSGSDLEQETSPAVRKDLAREYEVQDDDEDWLKSPQGEGEETGDVVEEEGEEGFLEFVRTSLGLTKEQYEQVMEKRKKEGRYVPETAASGGGASKERSAGSTTTETKTASAPGPSTATGPPQPKPDITTFDEAMDEMESHIASLPSAAPPTPPAATVPSPSSTSTTTADRKPGVEEEQDLSLLSTLLSSSGNEAADLPRSLLQYLPPDLLKRLEEMGGEEGDKINMLKHFLKSQEAGAGAGAVGVLAGRLGVGAFPTGQREGEREREEDQDMEM